MLSKACNVHFVPIDFDRLQCTVQCTLVSSVYYLVQSLLLCVFSCLHCAECSRLCAMQCRMQCGWGGLVGCGGRIRPAASHYLLHSAADHPSPPPLPHIWTAFNPLLHLAFHSTPKHSCTYCCTPNNVCNTFYLTSNWLNCHHLKLTNGKKLAVAQFIFTPAMDCLSRTWVSGQIKSKHPYLDLESFGHQIFALVS